MLAHKSFSFVQVLSNLVGLSMDAERRRLVKLYTQLCEKFFETSYNYVDCKQQSCSFEQFKAVMQDPSGLPHACFKLMINGFWTDTRDARLALSEGDEWKLEHTVQPVFVYVLGEDTCCKVFYSSRFIPDVLNSRDYLEAQSKMYSACEGIGLTRSHYLDGCTYTTDFCQIINGCYVRDAVKSIGIISGPEH